MSNKYLLFLFTFLSLTFYSCAQTQSDNSIPEDYARRKLKEALSDTSAYKIIDNKTFIVKDAKTAINVVEPILFSIYSEKNIIKQQPYKTRLIDNYWLISGTLHTDHGGVFFIIIDATNARVIHVSHGK